MANTTKTGSCVTCPRCNGSGTIEAWDDPRDPWSGYYAACPACEQADPCYVGSICLPVQPAVRDALGEELMLSSGLEDIGERPHSHLCECNACDEWSWRTTGGCTSCWISPCRCVRSEAA